MSKSKSIKKQTEVTEIVIPVKQESGKKTAKKPPSDKSKAVIVTSAVNDSVEEEVKSASKEIKVGKTKVIRDSFSFPEQDYVKISELKKTCLAAGIYVKKSEVLRAGLHLLTQLKLSDLKKAVEQVE